MNGDAEARRTTGGDLVRWVDADNRADRGLLRGTLKSLTKSARVAGPKAIATGRWLTDLLADAAEHLVIRDRATLERHFGARGDRLLFAIVESATRTSVAVGALAGALASAEEFVPATLVSAPAQLAVETLLAAAVELKMIGELRAAAGRPVTGTSVERGRELLTAWARQRGTPSRTAREELGRIIRRRLVRRMGRNIATYAPLLAGAAAGAELNRRATRHLAERVLDDLRL